MLNIFYGCLSNTRREDQTPRIENGGSAVGVFYTVPSRIADGTGPIAAATTRGGQVFGSRKVPKGTTI